MGFPDSLDGYSLPPRLPSPCNSPPPVLTLPEPAIEPCLPSLQLPSTRELDTEESHFQNLMSLHMRHKIAYVNTQPTTKELFQAVMRFSEQNAREADELVAALFNADQAVKVIAELPVEESNKFLRIIAEIESYNADAKKREDEHRLRSVSSSRMLRSRSPSIPYVPLESPTIPSSPGVSINKHLESKTDADMILTLQNHTAYNFDEEDSIEESPDILSLSIQTPEDQREPDLSRSPIFTPDTPSDEPAAQPTQSPSKQPTDLRDDGALVVQPEKDDEENYSCCGSVLPGQDSIICESCRKWYHEDCLIKRFGMEKPDVVHLKTSDDIFTCQRCKGNPRKRRRVATGKDLGSRKRFKVRIKDIPPAVLEDYKQNGIRWLGYLGIRNLLKSEIPKERLIPVKAWEPTKLPPEWFGQGSLSFETNDVLHLMVQESVDTIEAQQRVLDEFVELAPTFFEPGMKFQITDATHLRILEYLDSEKFEHLDDGDPIYNKDPPEFYNEIETAAEDIFDEHTVNSHIFKKRKAVWQSLEEKFGVQILSKLSRQIQGHSCLKECFGEYKNLVERDLIKILETPELVPFRKQCKQRDWKMQSTNGADAYQKYISTLEKEGLEPISFDLIIRRLKRSKYKTVDVLIKELSNVFKCAQCTYKITHVDFKKIADYGQSILNDLFKFRESMETDDG